MAVGWNTMTIARSMILPQFKSSSRKNEFKSADSKDEKFVNIKVRKTFIESWIFNNLKKYESNILFKSYICNVFEFVKQFHLNVIYIIFF